MAAVTIPLTTGGTIPFDASLEEATQYRLQSKYITYGVVPYAYAAPPPASAREVLRLLGASAEALFDEQLVSNTGLASALTAKYADHSQRHLHVRIADGVRSVVLSAPDAFGRDVVPNHETIAWARMAFTADTLSLYHQIQERDPFITQCLERHGLSRASPRVARLLHETPETHWIRHDTRNVKSMLQPSTDAYLPVMCQGGDTQAQLFGAMHHMALYPSRDEALPVHKWKETDVFTNAMMDLYNAWWKEIKAVFQVTLYKDFLSNEVYKELRTELLRRYSKKALTEIKDYIIKPSNWSRYRKDYALYPDDTSLRVGGNNAFNDINNRNKDSHFWMSPHQAEFRNNIKAWLCSKKMVHYFALRKIYAFATSDNPPKRRDNDDDIEHESRQVLYYVMKSTFAYKWKPTGKLTTHLPVVVTFNKVATKERLSLLLDNTIDNAYYFSKWALIARSVFQGVGTLHDHWMRVMDLVVNNPEPDAATTRAMLTHIPDWNATMHLNISSLLHKVIALRQQWLKECDTRDTGFADFDDTVLGGLIGVFTAIRGEWNAILHQNDLVQRAQVLAPISYAAPSPISQVAMQIHEYISHIQLNAEQARFLSCIRGANATVMQQKLHRLRVPIAGIAPWEHAVSLRPQRSVTVVNAPRPPTIHVYKDFLKQNMLRYDVSRNYATEVNSVDGFDAGEGNRSEYAAIQPRSLPNDVDTAARLREPGNLVPRMKVHGGYAVEDCFRYDYSYTGHDEVYPPNEFGMIITNPSTGQEVKPDQKRYFQHKLIVLWEDLELPYDTPNLTLQTILDRFEPQLDGASPKRKAWVWYLGPGQQLLVNRPGLARWELTYVPNASVPYMGTVEHFLCVDTLPRHFNYWHVPLAHEANTTSNSTERRIPWLIQRDHLLNLYLYIATYQTGRLQWLVQRLRPVYDDWWGAKATRMFLDYCVAAEPKPPHLLQRLQHGLYWVYVDRHSDAWRNIRIQMDVRQQWFGDELTINTLKAMRDSISGAATQGIELANDSHMVSRMEAFYAFFERDDALTTPTHYYFKIRDAARPKAHDKYSLRIRGVTIPNTRAPQSINSVVPTMDFAPMEYLFDPNVDAPEDEQGEFVVAPPFSTLNVDMKQYRSVYRRGLCAIDFEVQLVLETEDGEESEQWGMRRWVYYQTTVLLEPTDTSQWFVQEGHMLPPSDTVQYVSYRSDNDVRIPLSDQGRSGWKGVFDVIYERIERTLKRRGKKLVYHRNPFKLTKMQLVEEMLPQVLEEHGVTQEQFEKLTAAQRSQYRQTAEQRAALEENAKTMVRLKLLPVDEEGADLYAAEHKDEEMIKAKKDMTKQEELKERRKAARDAIRDNKREKREKRLGLTIQRGGSSDSDSEVSGSDSDSDSDFVSDPDDPEVPSGTTSSDTDSSSSSEDDEEGEAEGDAGAEQDDEGDAPMVGGMGTLRIY